MTGLRRVWYALLLLMVGGACQAVPSTWSGTMACDELQNSPNATSTAPFKGNVILTIDGDRAWLERKFATGAERSEGIVLKGQPLQLSGLGWFYGKESRPWATRATLTATGANYFGPAVLHSADGRTKFRDCLVSLTSDAPVQATAPAASPSKVQAPARPAASQRLAPLPGYSVVADGAAALSATEHKALSGKLQAINTKADREIAVVTVTSLGAEELQTYARRLIDDWKLGSRRDGRGVLILLATADRRVRIEVTPALGPDISDRLAGDVISRLLAPAFRRGEFAQGLEEAVDELAGLAAQAPAPTVAVSAVPAVPPALTSLQRRQTDAASAPAPEAPAAVVSTSSVQPPVPATNLQRLVHSFAPPSGPSAFSASDWDNLNALQSIRWVEPGPVVDTSGAFSRNGGAVLSDLGDSLVSYRGARTMVTHMSISTASVEPQPGRFAELIRRQLAAASVRDVRGPCQEEQDLDRSAVFEITLADKRPVYARLSRGLGTQGRETTEFEFALGDAEWSCEMRSPSSVETASERPAGNLTEGQPPLTWANPSWLNRAAWALAGLAALALPLLFILASAGAHEDLSLRIFFDIFNKTGKVDPYGANLQALGLLLVVFLAFVLIGPLVIWNKVISPSVQRNDSEVRTICCFDSAPKLSADGRLAAEVYRPGWLLTQFISDLGSGLESVRKYELQIVDTERGAPLDLRLAGARGDTSTLKFESTKLHSSNDVSIHADRIEVIDRSLSQSSRVLLSVQASQLGLKRIAGFEQDAKILARLQAPGTSVNALADNSGFSEYEGRIEVLDTATGQRKQVDLPFATEIIKGAPQSPALLITRRSPAGFWSSIGSTAAGFQEFQRVSIVDVRSGSVLLNDEFFGESPRYVGASADGRRHFLLAGKYLKVYTVAEQ